MNNLLHSHNLIACTVVCGISNATKITVLQESEEVHVIDHKMPSREHLGNAFHECKVARISFSNTPKENIAHGWSVTHDKEGEEQLNSCN